MKITIHPIRDSPSIVDLSVSSEKEVNRKNSKSMPLRLNMRMFVSVCAWNSVQSRQGKLPNL